MSVRDRADGDVAVRMQLRGNGVVADVPLPLRVRGGGVLVARSSTRSRFTYRGEHPVRVVGAAAPATTSDDEPVCNVARTVASRPRRRIRPRPRRRGDRDAALPHRIDHRARHQQRVHRPRPRPAPSQLRHPQGTHLASRQPRRDQDDHEPPAKRAVIDDAARS